MPVTVKPAGHPAKILNSDSYSPKPVESSVELLYGACPEDFSKVKDLLQSSLTDFDEAEPIYASKNGFVHGAIKAYSNHHNLVIRLEDVWFAILTQLSSYINGHAEQLRGKFVAHEGKKELMLKYTRNNRFNLDWGIFAQDMANALEINVVDPDLRQWIMPCFSTTTYHDEILASILMMGALKSYFTYTCWTPCGLSAVTLLGEKEDWELLLEKLEKLKTFGEDTMKWYGLLVPIVSRFVETFDKPKANEILLFWNCIAHYKRQSGSTYYCGWITASCYWDKQGNCLYEKPHRSSDQGEGSNFAAWRNSDCPRLQLDNAFYERVDTRDEPIGYSAVAARIEDGNAGGYQCDAIMIAGSVGWKWTSSGEKSDSGEVGLDTVQAVSGCWMFEEYSAEDRTEAAKMSEEDRAKQIAGWERNLKRIKF